MGKETDKSIASVLKKTLKTGLRGGVTHDKWGGKERIENVAGVIHDPYDSRRLQEPDSTDWYRKGGRVSIEEAAETQLNLQKRHDQAINDENGGIFRTRKGRLPCQDQDDY
ncbi:MAG: hypothetical protein PHX72_00250 [Candidatus Shapirobacteria bacterium]|nr:hypothetical protein [Candidatus Shapirobacteria bacterium]